MRIMNAIFDLKKTMIVALVALACSTASARPSHYRMHRHHVRPAATVVVKKCGCPCKKHHKHVKRVRCWR